MRIFGLLLLAVECLLSVAAHSEDLPKRLPTGFYTDIPPYLREILIKSSNLSGPDYIPYINSIPEATKAELRKYLAAEVKLDPENYDGLRFDLRDEEVVSRWINNFERTGDFGNMDVHGRPDIIHRFVHLIYRDEPPGDYEKGLSISVMASSLIGHIIERTEQFPPELQQWGRSAIANGDSRAVLRRWWEANKESIEQGRYDLVQPGPPWPWTVKEPSTHEVSPDREVPAGSGKSPPAHPNSILPPTVSTPVGSTVETSTPSIALLWTGAAAAVALLVGLFEVL